MTSKNKKQRNRSDNSHCITNTASDRAQLRSVCITYNQTDVFCDIKKQRNRSDSAGLNAVWLYVVPTF